MKIRRLTPEDLETIKPWYGADFMWDTFVGKAQGYVAEQDGQLVATGFLIETNAGFAMLEHLQTNKSLREITQGRGLILVAGAIMNKATAMGFRCILGFTEETNTSVRGMHKKVFKADESPPLRLVHRLL